MAGRRTNFGQRHDHAVAGRTKEVLSCCSTVKASRLSPSIAAIEARTNRVLNRSAIQRFNALSRLSLKLDEIRLLLKLLPFPFETVDAFLCVRMASEPGNIHIG